MGLPDSKAPVEAVVNLLSDELRAVIRALPEHLKDTVPEQLKLDTGPASKLLYADWTRIVVSDVSGL
jgi:hypothetical protein